MGGVYRGAEQQEWTLTAQSERSSRFRSFEGDDRQWIESIRAKHDPEAKNIDAHFTLVFPAVMPLRATEAHVTRVAHSTEPIRFVLRRATVAPHAIGSGGHVFLIPEDGRDALAGLHDRLYEGVAAAAPEVEYVLYAARDGCGGNRDRSAAYLAGELNAKGLSIRGSISELVLVDVTSAEIRPVAHFPLGSLV